MQKPARSIVLFLLLLSNVVIAQQPNTDSLLRVLGQSQEDTNKVIIYRMLTGIIRTTEPLKAVEYGKAGAKLGIKLGWDKGVAGCLLNVSASYISAAKFDSALVYIDSAIGFSYKAGDPNRLALAYLNKADIEMQLNNLAQSLKDCDSSLRYAEIADNNDRRARIYQTVGSVYYMQQNYPQSILYYNKAHTLYESIGNRQMSAVVLNNEATIYKHMGQHEKAEAAYLEAIEIGKAVNDLSNLSMYHENLADVYVLLKKLAVAEKYAGIAMDYAVLQQNNSQLANAWECLGRIYMAQGNYKLSINAGEKAYQLSKQEDLITVMHEASDLLSQAYLKAGNTAKAYEFLSIHKQISDSLLRKQFDENIADMQTRFEVKEKDNEIRLLGNEKLLQQQKLQQQRVLMITTVAIVLLVLFGVGLLINRYRLRQQMNQLVLRNRIAADLHDEVGSSLSSIHMLSQMAAQKAGAGTTQQEMLSRMSTHARETMDKMSDIVWMIKPGEAEAANLKQRMEHFAYELCSSQNIETTIQLDELEKWKLTMNDRKNIYLLFKEALNNAIKYSGATHISIQSGASAKNYSLEIRDNGKGFNPEETERGNGLDNMNNRAIEMKGRLDIVSLIGNGTSIKFTMPA